MPIRRDKNQKNESLIEFYKREEWTDSFEAAARRMIEVVNWLNRTFKQTELIGSTSHQRLAIHASNDDDADWAVIISNWGLEEYYVEYKMPENQSPWKDAWVHGTATGFDELTQYLVIAMKATKNWKGNDELANA